MDSNAELPVKSPVSSADDHPEEHTSLPSTETHPSEEQQPVVVIPRVMFNYVVIAVVCLVLGVVIGFVASDRVAQQTRVSTEALIQQTVATAVAALPRESESVGPDPNVRHDVSIENRPSIGSPDAPIVLVEFGDFHCGYCKRFHDQTITPLLENYGDQILFVFRDFPILGPDSFQAALAAYCANDQGAFWGFHDRLFSAPTQLVRDQFLAYAQELELDVDRFTECYDNAEGQAAVVQDYNDASGLGVTGTPTFFINGRIFIGAQPYEQFVAAIEGELSEMNSQQAS